MTDLPDEDRAIQQRQMARAWGAYSRDTSPETDRWRLAAAWSMPAWRKLRMAAEMSEATRQLTLAGLRRRHPDADEQEIRFQFALLLFGSDMAHRLCGRPPSEEEADAA
jgi:hypothetical protein